MAFRRWKKGEQAEKIKADEKAISKGISNKLDQVLVAESNINKWTELKKKITQKFLFIFIFIIVAVIAGYVVLKPEPAALPEKPTTTSEGVELKKLSEEELLKEVDKLVLLKKFKSAEELINYQDNPNARNAQISLALVYANQNKPNDAIRILKGIESTSGDHWELAKMIGEQYQNAGDKSNALAYYKKSLSLLEKEADFPMKSEEIAYVKSFIRSIEGIKSIKGLGQ